MTRDVFKAGLPRVLAVDGWWLGPGPVTDPPLHRTTDAGRAVWLGGRNLAGLLVLVALADLLFWHYKPGLSVALFAAAILAAATVNHFPRRELAAPFAVLVIGAMPVIEHVQVLSLAFQLLSLTAALLMAHGKVMPLASLTLATFVWLRGYPARCVVPPVRAALTVARTSGSGTNTSINLRRFARNWGIPLGGTLVFAALLLDANPVLAQLFSLRLDPLPLIDRVLFWAGIALLLAPFLDVHLPQTVPTGGPARSMPGLGINPGSVLRGLVLFNLLIGLQVVTDLSILIGGASLPQGMTYAEYAHRGAYPLLATALLAGAFALLSRPYLREHPAIRPLMLLWLGQNLVLCGAALLRLDLYISAYGLTYLRAWSLIWMVLVAAGLALTLWQVVVGHDNRWVMLRTGAMGLVTLYVAAFVNFAGVIATYNIRNGHLDTWYLCQLGPMAAGALLSGGVIDKNGWNDAGSCFVDFPQQQDWREWGFRSWRVQSYVAAVEMRGAPDENPGRR